MKRLNVDIEDELHTNLKVMSAQTGDTISVVVRVLLEGFFTKNSAEVGVVPKGVPIEDPELDPALKARLLKEQAVKAFNGKELKKCKNGHYIPDGRFKCLEKGCKYA
jgi:hypothetical protein